jgi:TRAP-type C4-dicarboxylate transport system permease small subunit
MGESLAQAQARPSGLARCAIEWWALGGGIVLLAVALMTTWSAFSGWVFGKPLPGDFELTEILVAVAVFTFLPYCQQTDANVTADLFTARAGPRALAAFRLLGGLLALMVALVLAWRTWAGLLDYRKYVETTAILKIPIWWAYVPALASLALLVLACLIVLRDELRALRG